MDDARQETELVGAGLASARRFSLFVSFERICCACDVFQCELLRAGMSYPLSILVRVVCRAYQSGLNGSGCRSIPPFLVPSQIQLRHTCSQNQAVHVVRYDIVGYLEEGGDKAHTCTTFPGRRKPESFPGPKGFYSESATSYFELNGK